MGEFWQTVSPWLLAAWGFVGFDGLAYLLAGMWFGDWMGRAHPDLWSWLRKGVKQGGDAAKDAVKS